MIGQNFPFLAIRWFLPFFWISRRARIAWGRFKAPCLYPGMGSLRRRSWCICALDLALQCLFDSPCWITLRFRVCYRWGRPYNSLTSANSNPGRKLHPSTCRLTMTVKLSGKVVRFEISTSGPEVVTNCKRKLLERMDHYALQISDIQEGARSRN